MMHNDDTSTPLRLHGRRQRLALNGGLTLVGLVVIFPLYWLFVMASNRTSDLYSTPPRLIPGSEFFANLGRVLQEVDLGRSLLNSVFVTGTHVVLSLLLCSLAGFIFAKYRFAGRQFLFVGLVATLVVPTGVMLLPLYQIYGSLGWINTFWPLIVPGAASAYGIFWMRQYAESSIPDDLVDAARMDGCGLLRTYWSVATPLMRPALAAFGVFTAMWTWNDYLWPLIILQDESKYTLPVSIALLNRNVGQSDYTAVMAGTLVSVVPLILLFLILRRTVIRNLLSGGLKE